MKKWFKRLACLFLCGILLSANTITAEDSVSVTLSHVYAKYADEEPKDVMTQIMEIEGSVMTDIAFDVQISSGESNLRYRLVQYKAENKQFKELISTTSSSFSINASEMYEGLPVYLLVYDSKGNNILVKLLMIRVNHGRINDIIPGGISSLYGEGQISVDMSELLPGMKFVLHPYLIPMTVRVFTDGRFVIGMGLNSSNVSFWKDAMAGKLPGNDTKKLTDAFWGNSENRSAVSGSNMGLIIEFAGSVQGNMYSNEPLKGQLTAFIGTGFDISGQYFILTWEVTVTGGADGFLNFELEFDEATKKYTGFNVERFGLGVKGGLELYGGLGLSSLASIGIYGAGSIAGYTMFYPTSEQDSLVLAGECGFKVKLLSRTLFSYSIVSGSYEFVRKGKESLFGFCQQEGEPSISDYLLANNYAVSPVSVKEPASSGTWYTDGKDPELVTSTGLQGYEKDEDFAHLVAENIYPDNRLQIVETGTRNVPQMNVIFLGSDPSREEGNRSRLMDLFYIEGMDYLSDPDWVIYETDDGTADYDPYAFHSDRQSSWRTYIVWRNGTKAFNARSTLKEICENSDIWYAEFQYGNVWHNQSRVTEYAGSESGLFATGAKVSEESSGRPIVTYYLNSTSDPAGLDDSFVHDVYTARQNEDGSWTNEAVFSVRGSISELESGDFGDSQKIAVSYDHTDENNKRISRVELWDGSEKIFERDNATNGRFVRFGYDEIMFSWLENGRLYCISESSMDTISALTPEDIRIPSSDYQIYGRYGSNTIYLLGTASKESSEDIYAIASLDKGRTWRRIELTDIENNALVNELSIASTSTDEPILFYSVQKYSPNYDESVTDAENYLHSEQQNPSFAGLQKIMVGQDDPRFDDGQTDLYVKARRANSKVSITDVTFTDEDSARKGKATPLTMKIENTGLYDISHLYLFADGVKIYDQDVSLKYGESMEIETEYTVPADAPNEPLDVVFSASSRDSNVIESRYTATLGVGHFSAVYTHAYRYSEALDFSITNHGFAERKARVVIIDPDSDQILQDNTYTIPSGQTRSNMYTLIKGTWRDEGHENIGVLILDEGESLDNVDSNRSAIFRGLEEIYMQDISKMPIYSNDSTPSNGSSSNSGSIGHAEQPKESSYKIPVTYVAETPRESEESVVVEQEAHESKPSQTEETAAENVPDAKEDTVKEKKSHSFIYLILISAIAALLLFLLFFLLLRRRDEEEE